MPGQVHALGEHWVVLRRAWHVLYRRHAVPNDHLATIEPPPQPAVEVMGTPKHHVVIKCHRSCSSALLLLVQNGLSLALPAVAPQEGD